MFKLPLLASCQWNCGIPLVLDFLVIGPEVDKPLPNLFDPCIMVWNIVKAFFQGMKYKGD